MKLKCLICGKRFNHLGSHIWHRHKITAREYKEEFGLPYKMALISTEVKLKKQDAFEKDREKYLVNIINNKKWQFKKGKSGIRRISQRERMEIFIIILLFLAIFDSNTRNEELEEKIEELEEENDAYIEFE